MPSPIQVMAIPKVIQGYHVLCQARAGTGKTAVFVLGILQNLAKSDSVPQYQPHQCLVIANTR